MRAPDACMVKDHGPLWSPEPDRPMVSLVRNGPGKGGQASDDVVKPNRSGLPGLPLQEAGVRALAHESQDRR